jgi:hypothetical protein
MLRYFGVRLLIPADDIAGNLCVDQAGVNRVHADAVLDVFQSGRPRQADHAVLGGDVGTDTGVAGQRANRRVVDDRAAALAFHLLQFVLHAAPNAAQVDPNHAIPVFAGAVGGRGDARHHPGVVERGVQSAELGNSSVHHSLNLCVVTHIAAEGDCPMASGHQLLGFRLHGVFSEVGHHNGRACLGKRLRRRQPHAGGCSGHECHLATKVQRIVIHVDVFFFFAKTAFLDSAQHNPERRRAGSSAYH